MTSATIDISRRWREEALNLPRSLFAPEEQYVYRRGVPYDFVDILDFNLTIPT